MRRFVLLRLVALIPVLLGVSLIVFVLMKVIPGDPALFRSFVGSEKGLDEIRAELGLNESLPKQYVNWITDLSQGDFGDSLTSGVPVANLIEPKIVNSAILTGSAMVFTIIAGVGIGVAAAVRRYSLFDRLIMSCTLVVANVPVFWLGLLAIWLFAVQLRWLPSGGMRSFSQDGGGLSDIVIHLILPTISAGAISAAVVARLVRSTLLEVFEQDYIRALRAKGLRERSIVLRHALRNALPPVVTIVGLQVGYIMGGALFTEVVFNWPGIGQELFRSITSRDLPVVQAAVLSLSLIFVLANLLTDIVISFADPRLRRA